MREGSYRQKVNFDDWKVARFPAHFFNTSAYGTCGCGATALALLTGIKPSSFPFVPWTPTFMKKFLKSRGFDIVELTQRNVTSTKYVLAPLSGRHVILAWIRLAKKQSSWVVFHNSICFHNFETTPLDPYGILNQPTVQTYLVKHPTWMATCPFDEKSQSPCELCGSNM